MSLFRHAIAAAVAAGALVAGPAGAMPFKIFQITDNATTDMDVSIDGRDLAWTQFEVDTPPYNYDVRARIDGTAYSISSGTGSDLAPAISRGRVVWRHDGELSSWKDGTVTPLATGGGVQGHDVEGQRVFINQRPSGVFGAEILRQTAGGFTLVTPGDDYTNRGIRLSDGDAVWVRSETARISGSLPGLPLGYGTNYSPFGFVQPRGGDVALYTGSDGTWRTITDATQREFEPDVSQGRVVWSAWDGTDLEIYLWDDGVVTQLTDNDTEDRGPRISGENVAWYGWDGTDYEIFFFDGTTTHQVTDDDRHQFGVDLSGNAMAFRGWDGEDWEIYVANPAPEPGAAIPLLLVALRLSWARRRSA